MRHSPMRFRGHGGSSALAIRSFNDLPLFLVSVAGAPANYLGKAGFQAGQECSTTHVFGKSPCGCVRYFDLRLAPDMCAIPLVGAASLRRSLPSWLKYVALAGLCASRFSVL